MPHGGLLSRRQVRAGPAARMLVPFRLALGSWDELDGGLGALYIRLTADSRASHSELLLGFLMVQLEVTPNRVDDVHLSLFNAGSEATYPSTGPWAAFLDLGC